MTQVWPFVPDQRMTDVYEFFTDVMKAESAEKRVIVRSNPQRNIELRHLFDDDAHALYRAIAKRVSSTGEIYVPLWMVSSYINQAVSGQTVFSFDTRGLGFTEKFIIWSNYDDFEVLDIASVTDTSVTASAPLNRSYSSCYIIPLRKCLAVNGFRVSRNDFNNYVSSALFKAIDDEDILSQIPENDNIITYQDVPLIPYRPTRMSSLQESILDAVIEVDNGAGPFVLVKDLEYTIFNQTVEFNFQEREKLLNLVRFLCSLSGRSNPFWLPSYFNEITLKNTANSQATVKRVLDRLEYEGKHVYLELKNGQKFLRSVATASLTSGNIVMTFNSPLGQSVTPDDVLQFCFMVPVRSETDVFEIQYSPGMIGNISFAVTEVSEL